MLEKLLFGRTGHTSTRIIFGAAALGGASPAQADHALEILLKYGINHIDTAASYGDSELRIAPWMEQHRDKFFLATKTGERSYQKARDQLHRSLERLRVDQVDLIQLHNLVDPTEWQIAMGEDGALRALQEARQEGLVRFIGVTGHGIPIPRMHLQSLQHFDFDSVLLPYNYPVMQVGSYAPDFEELLRLCQERQVAVQTIKSIARRSWGETEHNTTTWYQPLEEEDDIRVAVHWVLSRPGIFLNTASDIGLLEKILKAAEEVQPTSDEDIKQVVKREEMASLFD